MKKIVLTGGGTAGHVTPNLALIPELLKEGYQLDTALVESNGMVSFTFENQGNTYLAGAFATEDAFWLIQAGCPSGNFNSQKETLQKILNSVTFS